MNPGLSVHIAPRSWHHLPKLIPACCGGECWVYCSLLHEYICNAWWCFLVALCAEHAWIDCFHASHFWVTLLTFFAHTHTHMLTWTHTHTHHHPPTHVNTNTTTTVTHTYIHTHWDSKTWKQNTDWHFQYLTNHEPSWYIHFIWRKAVFALSPLNLILKLIQSVQCSLHNQFSFFSYIYLLNHLAWEFQPLDNNICLSETFWSGVQSCKKQN